MGPLELEILAPMIVAVVLTLTVGGVVLLRPLSRRLGDLLEAMAKEKQQPQLSGEVERVRELLETMNGRLSLLEERQDFTDALMADPERRRLRGTRAEGGGDPGAPNARYGPPIRETPKGRILADPAL